MEIEELWSATDTTDLPYTTGQLNRIDKDGKVFYQLGLDGPFSGDPVINLDRKDLKDLHSAIEQELYPERFPPIATPGLSEKQAEDLRTSAELMAQLGFTRTRIKEVLQKTLEHKSHKCEPPNIGNPFDRWTCSVCLQGWWVDEVTFGLDGAVVSWEKD